MFSAKHRRYFEDVPAIKPYAWWKDCSLVKVIHDPLSNTYEILGKTDEGEKFVTIVMDESRATKNHKKSRAYCFLAGAAATVILGLIEKVYGFTNQTYIDWSPYAALGFALFYGVSATIDRLIGKAANK